MGASSQPRRVRGVRDVLELHLTPETRPDGEAGAGQGGRVGAGAGEGQDGQGRGRGGLGQGQGKGRAEAGQGRPTQGCRGRLSNCKSSLRVQRAFSCACSLPSCRDPLPGSPLKKEEKFPAAQAPTPLTPQSAPGEALRS